MFPSGLCHNQWNCTQEKKEKIKTCVEHTNLGVGRRRLRELIFSLDFSEKRSFIGTADK